MSNKTFVKKSKSNFVELTNNGIDQLRLDINFCIHIDDEEVKLSQLETCENLNNLKIIEQIDSSANLNIVIENLSPILKKIDLKEIDT